MSRGVNQSFTKTELETKKIDGKTVHETIEDALIALGTMGRISTKSVPGFWEEWYGDLEISEDLRELARCPINNEPRRQQGTVVYFFEKWERKRKDMLSWHMFYLFSLFNAGFRHIACDVDRHGARHAATSRWLHISLTPLQATNATATVIGFFFFLKSVQTNMLT